MTIDHPPAKRMRMSPHSGDDEAVNMIPEDKAGAGAGEVSVQCIAPYEDHKWRNVGKASLGMSGDSVQYTQALQPPYHLLSMLRLKGNSTKGLSVTGRNTMVFVVLAGEVTVVIHSTQFVARKGDSFYVPPKNSYNIINTNDQQAELSILQYQYDGPLYNQQTNS